MPEYRKNIPLMEARKKAGLTLKKAAKGIGISLQVYSGYETGRLYPIKEEQEKVCGFYSGLGFFLFEDDVFPEKIKDLTERRYERRHITKKERIREIVYLPPSDIRYLSDHIPAGMPADYDIETEVIGKELSEGVRKVLSSLRPRDEKVLQMRYGIDEPTYDEMGRSFGVTRERIRQIELRALRRLKDSGNAKKLRPFLERDE